MGGIYYLDGGVSWAAPSLANVLLPVDKKVNISDDIQRKSERRASKYARMDECSGQ